jgi:hypothetical protein
MFGFPTSRLDDILGYVYLILKYTLNESKTLGYCRFPLANPHKGPVLHYVPHPIPFTTA